MAIYIYFVTAPYAAPGVKMAMLFFYSGLISNRIGTGQAIWIWKEGYHVIFQERKRIDAD
ncbi:MAG: hypothetical protein ABIJ50_11420 [Pseudomonadota bacterium]